MLNAQHVSMPDFRLFQRWHSSTAALHSLSREHRAEQCLSAPDRELPVEADMGSFPSHFRKPFKVFSSSWILIIESQVHKKLRRTWLSNLLPENPFIKKHLHNLNQIVMYANTKSSHSDLKSPQPHYCSQAMAWATGSKHFRMSFWTSCCRNTKFIQLTTNLSIFHFCLKNPNRKAAISQD